jgi:hypothetical protein
MNFQGNEKKDNLNENFERVDGLFDKIKHAGTKFKNKEALVSAIIDGAEKIHAKKKSTGASFLFFSIILAVSCIIFGYINLKENNFMTAVPITFEDSSQILYNIGSDSAVSFTNDALGTIISLSLICILLSLSVVSVCYFIVTAFSFLARPAQTTIFLTY